MDPGSFSIVVAISLNVFVPREEYLRKIALKVLLASWHKKSVKKMCSAQVMTTVMTGRAFYLSGIEYITGTFTVLVWTQHPG